VREQLEVVRSKGSGNFEMSGRTSEESDEPALAVEERYISGRGCEAPGHSLHLASERTVSLMNKLCLLFRAIQSPQLTTNYLHPRPWLSSS
jgi:hypothetical protein